MGWRDVVGHLRRSELLESVEAKTRVRCFTRTGQVYVGKWEKVRGSVNKCGDSPKTRTWCKKNGGKTSGDGGLLQIAERME